MEKIKVYIFNAYQGKVLRGAERYVSELSKRLRKYFDVEVVAGNKKEIKRWPVIWRFFIDPCGLQVLFFTLLNIPKVIFKRPKIVIALNGGLQVFLLRIVTFLYGGKLIVSGQSGIGWDDRINLLCFPNVFVGLTGYQSKWARKVNPFIKVVTIPNGVDLTKFKPGLKEKGSVVLGVGALDSWKRWDLAISAVSRLENVKLIIVGRGRDEKVLESFGKKLLGKNFEIKSSSFEKMPEYYKRAKVFTYPTNKKESFGIVMVEAMASGLPVVATKDPIRKEIVGGSGLLVDPTDIESYSAAIKKTLKKDWGSTPRKQAENFGWDKIAVQYEKLFNEI